jgi:hypothetical protein
MKSEKITGTKRKANDLTSSPHKKPRKLLHPLLHPLFASIKKNNTSLANTLLNHIESRNISLSGLDENDNTALHHALLMQNIEVAERLVEVIANKAWQYNMEDDAIHKSNNQGETPLFLALQIKAADIVLSLLNNDVDIDTEHLIIKDSALLYCVSLTSDEPLNEIQKEQITQIKQNLVNNPELKGAEDAIKEIENIKTYIVEKTDHSTDKLDKYYDAILSHIKNQFNILRPDDDINHKLAEKLTLKIYCGINTAIDIAKKTFPEQITQRRQLTDILIEYCTSDHFTVQMQDSLPLQQSITKELGAHYANLQTEMDTATIETVVKSAISTWEEAQTISQNSTEHSR